LASTLLLVTLTVVSAASSATPGAWSIDSTRSFAQFSVRTLWFTHERGRFAGVHGALRRDGADLDVVDAWIDTASLMMDNTRALNEARGPGFFDATRYPRIHFVSSPFANAALREGGTLQGILDLHGQQRMVQFTLLPSACPAQPLGCTIRVHGTLSRSTFAMRAHRGLLSDRVVLDLDIMLGESG